jgi:hypothetical protein
MGGKIGESRLSVSSLTPAVARVKAGFASSKASGVSEFSIVAGRRRQSWRGNSSVQEKQ